MFGNLGLWLNNQTKNIQYPVDAAVALGGGSDRQVTAVQLVLDKNASAVWVTGPEVDIMLQPEEGDLFLNRSNGTTWTDAEDVLNVLKTKMNFKTLIVTSDYHIRRAQTIFSIVANDKFHMTFNIQWLSVPNKIFSLADWRKTPEGRKIVLNEYGGIISALIKRRP